MRSSSEALRRSLCRSSAGFRPIVLIALATPLALSACATSQSSTKTTALAPTLSEASVDAYGYAPVRITAFSDGSRIALPSHKPDAAKLAAVPPAAAPTTPGELAGKSSRPRGEIADLAADVAERKAATVSGALAASGTAGVPAASDALAAKAAASALSSKPSTTDRIAAAASALNPVDAVPATIAAVGETAGAVATATVTTTAKAYDAVTQRIGDTFKGEDTITGSASIDQMIERAAAENDIPSELAYAVVRVESHYNPKAKGSGVYGLSQIQPATARSLGFSGSTDDLYDPETNLRYGMKYLAGAWEKSGGDICGAAMKYKGGHRTTRMSKSAAVYCSNVKRHMAAIERRRAPANRETVVAGAQRQKQIEVASTAAETKRSLPGVTARASVIKTAPSASSIPAPLIAAAASPSGRSVAASAAPVTAAARGASMAVPADSREVRGGRVVKTSAPVTSVLGIAE